jgi:hypothetical protein
MTLENKRQSGGLLKRTETNSNYMNEIEHIRDGPVLSFCGDADKFSDLKSSSFLMNNHRVSRRYPELDSYSLVALV